MPPLWHRSGSGPFDEARGGEGRFWRLIEERTQPNADAAAIDRRIWDLFGETWAVLFTDLAGFSRHAARFGITHFLQVIFEQKKLLLPVVESHDGILVKVEADSLLLLFRHAERALACAVEMQRTCAKVNERRRPEEQILLCVGIGYGKLLRISDQDVYGAEVNAASKLGEDTAAASEVLITSGARDAVGEMAGIRFEELGIVVPGSDENYRVLY